MATLGAREPNRDNREEVGELRLVQAGRRRTVWERYIKRPFDLIVSCALLLALSPLLASVALMVRMLIGSPVIYRQERVGVGGRRFTIYKFRTMISDRRQGDEGYTGPERRRTHKSARDPRVVPFGRFMRKFSLDELPQFWNVVIGDMSLVGPRPELPSIVGEYEDWQHDRHVVRPGITGIWQVWSRDELLKDRTDLDILYIENLNFTTDLRILLRTPLAVLGRRNGF